MEGTSNICSKCFEEDPTNYRLLSIECALRSTHGKNLTSYVSVCWKEGRFHKIRPVPEDFEGWFALCNLGPKCKGEKCTFAHSEVEKRFWNSSKEKRGVKQSARTNFNPGRSKVPWVNKMHMHAANNPQPTFASKAMVQPNGRPTLQLGKQLQPKGHHIPVTTPIIKPLQQKQPPAETKMLTPANYKVKFQNLIHLEQIVHANILTQRCDGDFELVYSPSKYSQVEAYLQGISGDNISYVTQACNSLSITYAGKYIYAAISPKNYHHTEDVLYVSLDEEQFERCFNFPLKKGKWKVFVKFLLKKGYFISLQRFVESLTADTIRRLMPSDNQFTPFQPINIDAHTESLHLDQCSEDQHNALVKIVSSPPTGPPVLVTGPFGTGKTRILALAALYFLKNGIEMKQKANILVCTQQNSSADKFLEYINCLLIRFPKEAYLARVTSQNRRFPPKNVCNLEKLEKDLTYRIQKGEHSNLIITTCQTAYKLQYQQWLGRGFFTHILLDEGAMMREPEAIAPLYFAEKEVKIVLAGDKMQVGPDLLVLGEQPRGKGLAVSLLERLEKYYQQIGGVATQYISTLVTNYRCHRDILNIVQNLFYASNLKCAAPDDSTHPLSSFSLHFVCSSITPPPHSSENPVNNLEADVVVDQLLRFTPGWPQDRWGKFDPLDICLISPSRSQTNKLKECLMKNIPEKLRQVICHPTYNTQGQESRAIFISTFETINEDGSTRNPTKSITDPYVFNTVLTRARSLVVSVGDPHLLLKMEEHMVRKYGKKAKCWSNYLESCLKNNTLSFHDSTKVLEADKKEYISKLKNMVSKHLAAKYTTEESTRTFDSDSTPMQKRDDTDTNSEECVIPDKYTGRLEQDFHVGKMLGKGGFAQVYEVTSKTDRGHYALKIVNLPKMKSSQQRILREVRGLRKLDQPTPHPHIVRYYGCWIDIVPLNDELCKRVPWKDIERGKLMPDDERADSGTSDLPEETADTGTSFTLTTSDSAVVFKSSSSKETKQSKKKESSISDTSTSTTMSRSLSTGVPLQGRPCLLIRTELCGKTLKQWLEKHKDRKRAKLFKYFEQILGAVNFIHKKKLAHRDLKPSNIFFATNSNGERVLKVGDFGLVAGNFANESPDLHSLAVQTRATHQVSFSGLVGTPLYMSPEQIEHSRYTEKVDIYSLGVIYFEMNYVCSSNHEKYKVIRRLQKSQYEVPVEFKKNLAREIVVIQKMMAHDPDDRPSAEHILESTFFDDLKKCIEEKPIYVPKM